MAPWTFWRCCQRSVGWVPVLFITFVVVWSYYAYVVELCVFTLSGNGENGKAVVYLVAFHLFFVMFVWSYWMTIFTSPASPSKEFYLSSSEKERYEKEFSQERQQEILRRAARDLPIYTTSASRTIRYCERCQLIKPDRAHHCSACDICILKMDHHCPWVNNCVGFSNYKFFLLFLLYSLLYCLFVATTVLQYFIKFWTNHSAHPHFHMDLMEMVFLLDAVKIGDKSLVMKRNTGCFQYFQAWVMVAVFQLALWGWIQNKLLLQIKMNMLEVLAQINPFLSNRLVNQKTDCWTVNLNG
ncbi:palmitoyltransferase ZDHHC20 isoform X4 [Eumetopias jubatus]|uniref:palmitoyltransferase ZDHHC20 isoform X4 n=1 Tax=Eumetopias jubatus TaxID=34886 RepID=UPI001016FD81|nr:palmitoyltransferase ZDHHC20 isoform X4 [Eumetopias jubatus]XP_027960779.1 palmitoyltransferase ZDHHC20 isoform X4 [Eumetopias jubatus]